MKSKKIMKLICFVFCFVFLAGSISVYAFADFVSLPESMDGTNVIEDLKAMNVDLSEYPRNPRADYVKIAKFVEFGYNYQGYQNDYGLYVYVYNPTGKPIQESDKNKIQIGLLNFNGRLISQKKYGLTMVSYSTEETYKYVFYKFKVNLYGSFYNDLNSGKRSYAISGIELKYSGNDNAIDYLIETTYSFTGFMAYHGLDPASNVSTLHCDMTELETVKVELHPATWKTLTSDKGVGYQYEVFSVYFAVDDYFVKKYGNLDDENLHGLRAVRGVYDEYTVNGLISNNSETIDSFTPYLGVNVENTTVCNYAFAPEPYSYTVGPCFNDPVLQNNSIYYLNRDKYRYVSKLCYAFKDFEDSFKNYTSDKLFKKLDLGDGTVRALTSKENFSYEVKSDDEILNAQIGKFNTNISGFTAWWCGVSGEWKASQSESYNSIMPLKMLTGSDFNFLYSDENNAANLFVSTSDYSGVKSFYNENNDDCSVYLMRFAVRDYYCNSVKCYFNRNLPVSKWDTNQDEHVYFEKSIFLNFDILEFDFENKDSEIVTLPVSASPINITGSIDPPMHNELNKPLGEKISDFIADHTPDLGKYALLIKVLAIVLILVAVVFVLSKFGGGIKLLFSGIGAVVSAPFKLVGKAIERSDRERELYNEKVKRDKDESREAKREARERERDEREKERDKYQREKDAVVEERQKKVDAEKAKMYSEKAQWYAEKAKTESKRNGGGKKK